MKFCAVSIAITEGAAWGVQMPLLNIEFSEHDFKCGIILLNMKFSEKSHILIGSYAIFDKSGMNFWFNTIHS